MLDFRVFGIAGKITKGLIFGAILFLLLFTLAANSIYEFLKITFIDESWVANGKLWLYWFCPFLFAVWTAWIYCKNKQMSVINTEIEVKESLSKHKGVILALSRPRKQPGEIIEKVKQTPEEAIQELFDEPSIGQLFKGLYTHADSLKHVWAISTTASYAYRKCIDEFLRKFIPNAKLRDEEGDYFCRTSATDETALIRQIQDIVSSIYSEKNLNNYRLAKKDIITDITGGTVTLTIGMLFGAIDSEIDIQYVEQQSGKRNVVPIGVTPKMILGKMGKYMIQLSKQQQ